MMFVLTLVLSVATTALAIRLVLWHVEGPGIRTAMSKAVCANRGHHRLTLAEHHWLEPETRYRARSSRWTVRAWSFGRRSSAPNVGRSAPRAARSSATDRRDPAPGTPTGIRPMKGDIMPTLAEAAATRQHREQQLLATAPEGSANHALAELPVTIAEWPEGLLIRLPLAETGRGDHKLIVVPVKYRRGADETSHSWECIIVSSDHPSYSVGGYTIVVTAAELKRGTQVTI